MHLDPLPGLREHYEIKRQLVKSASAPISRISSADISGLPVSLRLSPISSSSKRPRLKLRVFTVCWPTGPFRPRARKMCVVVQHHLGKGAAAHPRCIPPALALWIDPVPEPFNRISG